MVSELKQKYCNITKEVIMTYLKLCIHCEKKSNPKNAVNSLNNITEKYGLPSFAHTLQLAVNNGLKYENIE